MPSKQKTSTGSRIVEFLDHHRLDHSPEHYAFAHRYLFGVDRAFRDDVAGIIDGGVRISAEQVAALGGSAAPALANDLVAPQLDALTEQLLVVLGDAVTESGAFGRDLTVAAAGLVGEEPRSIKTIVATMIDRAVRAEAKLADMTAKAEGLRADLHDLRNDANRDRLTGLLNRAAMEEAIDAALAEGNTAHSLAFIDVDHFKRVNDTYGHGVGDRVLRAVAETLLIHCGAHKVARWGGEEFVILLERSIGDAAREVDAARLALGRRRLRIRENDAPLGEITFSAGVAGARSRDRSTWIEAADKLLYQAKQAGRDQVVSEPRLIAVHRS